ncbi:hypothetical protein JHK85_053644 [Glycine max]|nr:hypothetical protein JHK85_053644 [Glycine max]
MAQNSVLKRVGSAASNIVLFPFSYLINSSSEGSRNPIADSSLQVLLVLIHYHKCLVSEGYSVLKNQVSASSDSLPKENTYFSNNPYCRALERATDCELDCVDLEGNAHSDQLVKLPFAPLFDTLGMQREQKSTWNDLQWPNQASAFAHSPRDFDMNKVLEFGALLASGGQVQLWPYTAKGDFCRARSKWDYGRLSTLASEIVSSLESQVELGRGQEELLSLGAAPPLSSESFDMNIEAHRWLGLQKNLATTIIEEFSAIKNLIL